MTSIKPNVMSWLPGRLPTSFTECVRRGLGVR